MTLKKIEKIWGLLRIGLGLVFLWAFFDKVFGLGFATAADKSWLLGNSPTAGFLSFATRGPLAGIYQSMVGSAFVDWLFMLGLLLIGVALVLGVGVKLAGYAGALLMLMMWSAALPPKNHPFLDEHIIYGLVLIGLAQVKSGHWWGLGNWWRTTTLVKTYKWLQ
jgi:thiosulfate dehydrogenase (quinone) large subunit